MLHYSHVTLSHERCHFSASQIMFFVVLAFLIFNCYRLGYGLDISAVNINATDINLTATVCQKKDLNQAMCHLNCVRPPVLSAILSVIFSYQLLMAIFMQALPTSMSSMPQIDRLSQYLVVGAAVWIAFLPFYLLTLFGNCWRQVIICKYLLCAA